jgi:predicted Zn-dependent protease
MLRILTVAALAAGLSACAYNEQLGRNQFLLIDDSSLASSAEAAWTQIRRETPVSRDPAMNQTVQTVARRLITAAGLDNQNWEIVLFQDDSANAFALPGGRMGVNTGLFRVVQNEDQLAAVIGHELAHSAASHAAERASQTAAAQIGLGVASGVAGDSRFGEAISAYGGAGAQLGFLLPFSRQHELEADRLGVDYMQRAGYDPRQAIVLWQRMASAGGASQPAFMSTHPSDSTRIAALQDYLQQRGWA